MLGAFSLLTSFEPWTDKNVFLKSSIFLVKTNDVCVPKLSSVNVTVISADKEALSALENVIVSPGEYELDTVLVIFNSVIFLVVPSNVKAAFKPVPVPEVELGDILVKEVE